MQKLFMLASALVVSFSLVAQDGVAKTGDGKGAKPESREFSSIWPACVAVCQWPRSADVVGLRFTIPYSTSQENVTGIDIGFWGKSLYFEGIQLNVIRNYVVDSASGFQVGLYNTVGGGNLMGLQVGLWNEASNFSGLEVGLVNVVGEGNGFQVGLINRAETLNGYQVGLINIIRSSELPFLPLVNIGF